MEEEKGRRHLADSYENFLSEIEECAGKEEKGLREGISRGAAGEDVPVNVGKRAREMREKRGLSLQDISQRTGIALSMLKEIEDETVSPPLGMVIKLAKSLEMKMGYFISGEEYLSYTIVRRNDRKVISRYDSESGKYYGYEYEALAPHKRDRHMEPFMITLAPAGTEEERSTHDGQEFIYVLEGGVEVRLGGEVHILEPGDAIYYDSTAPHLVKCRGDEPARILAVLYVEK